MSQLNLSGISKPQEIGAYLCLKSKPGEEQSFEEMPLFFRLQTIS